MNIHTKCDNCNGLGIIPKFAHIQNGKCFNCNGKGGWTKAQMDRASKENERRRQRNIEIVNANNALIEKEKQEKRRVAKVSSQNPNGTHGLKGKKLISAAREWVRDNGENRDEFLKEFGWSNSRLFQIATHS